ncbi:hypothetical protein [Natrinema longum]|uniref:Uncharacterized protein n=1 Tax=Natrinema longum TaxID=370324 RepID=A0A8A2U3Q6_9EURY|nr:hypothetical protein [Natrinema longum]MBZ6494943.1 hypothetical protein [Natrinema longum]QSW83760.1 hypothetical protein J0X27_09715 [Natrinema longum]
MEVAVAGVRSVAGGPSSRSFRRLLAVWGTGLLDGKTGHSGSDPVRRCPFDSVNGARDEPNWRRFE